MNLFCFGQTELDQVHCVRMGVGNGLRPDVWRDFLHRFGNIKMCEVYGSTEGNLCFMNHVGKVGTVGRSNFIYKVSVSLNNAADSDLALLTQTVSQEQFLNVRNPLFNRTLLK